MKARIAGLIAASGLCLVAYSSAGAQKTAVAPGDCEGLTGLVLKDAKVTAASVVKPGAAPAAAGRAAATPSAPYCRVQITLKPEPTSNIRIEVWLPEAGRWNGKFLGTGNGGAAGSIQAGALAGGVARGYAVANTDMGSSSGAGGLNFGFGAGRPDLQKDFSYRSTDGMTLLGKQITAAYFGKKPRYSYFQGCSTGGGQAWEQIHRLPGEYDGVIAGAAANDRPNLHMTRIWDEWANVGAPDQTIPKLKLAMVQKAATAACDGLDGVKDGIIDDPRACKFDPASIVCMAGDAAECLTPAQVITMRKVYQGATNPRTHAQVYPGFERGSEGGIDLHWEGKPGPGGAVVVKDNLINWSAKYQKAHPDGVGFDFDKDVTMADADIAPLENYTDPKLAAFQKANGKVIIYHGWADALVPSRGTPNYYERIAKANGGFDRTANFARLFMVPGMGHCSGGVGPNQFDMLAALETWVEKGQAPQTILATRIARADAPAMSRPLCPYPKAAKWNGTGDVNAAASFSCAAPKG
jgi:feruloyl esterase